MANTHFIKTRVEPVMRDWLTQKYGTHFNRRSMPLRWHGEGIGTFEFDAVSEDETILASLSTDQNLKPGQRHKLMRDTTFMGLVPGVKTSILAVIDQAVASALRRELQRGRLPPATQIELIDLPPALGCTFAMLQ